MPSAPLEDEHFSRAGGTVAALFCSLPFVALGGAWLLGPVAFLASVVAGPWRRVGRIARSGGVALALLIAFIVWAGASQAWAAHPTPMALVALLAAGALVMLAMASGFGRPADLDVVRRAGTVGVGLLLAFLAIDAAFEFPIAQAIAPVGDGGDLDRWLAVTQQGTALAALWVWGAGAMLARRNRAGWGWTTAGLFMLALIAIAFALPDRRVLLALAVALAPALAALAWPRGTLAWTSVAAAVLALAAPLYLPSAAAFVCQQWRAVAHEEPPFAWLAQLDTWAYAADRIHEKLILGWGLGASTGFNDTHSLSGFTVPYVLGDPRSLPVQLWLETGAVGATLAAGAFAAFGLRAGAALANDRVAACAASGAMATACVIAVTSVGAWDLSWWAGVALAAAMVRSARGAP
jgi:hypothetical protein